jgi:hypothetical protein
MSCFFRLIFLTVLFLNFAQFKSLLAQPHLVLSEGFSLTQISGAAQAKQSSPINLGLSIEFLSSQKMGQEISIRSTYLVSQGLISSMAVGYGVNWYFTELGRAKFVTDGNREFSESELLSACLVFKVEAGRQLLRSFSSLGELEASSEFVGLVTGVKSFFNFTPNWAPGVYLLVGYDYGFGRFPFTGVQLQAGALVSIAL